MKESVHLALQYVDECVRNGAEIIVFPETWLPGYPVWLDYSPGAGIWDHPPAKVLFRLLTENSLIIEDEYFVRLQESAKEHNCLIIIGCHEKVGRTLFNTMFYFKSDGTYDLHRKMMPTYTERLVWGYGDGSTLPVFEHKGTNIGGLICWEHWMPLARAAMHNLGESVHVAAWPTVRESYAIASRHYAMEGRCFVLAAGLVQHRDDLFDGLDRVGGDSDALELLNSIESEKLNRGRSLIAAPDARVVAQAGEGEEILVAEINLAEIAEGLANLDTDGHYSRPDVFELNISTRDRSGVNWHEDASEE